MTSEVSAPPGLWAMVRSALRSLVRTWPRRIAIALIALVLVLVTALGGFRTVELPPPPQLAAGEAFDVGPAEMHASSFFVSDRVLPHMLPDGAQGWIGVLVDLTVHAADEWNPPAEVFSVPELADGAEANYAAITQDGSLLVQLEPDVPQQVAMLYPVPDTTAVGDEVELAVRTLYQQRSFFEGTVRWYTDDVGATVRLPRNDDVPPALIDED